MSETKRLTRSQVADLCGCRPGDIPTAPVYALTHYIPPGPIGEAYIRSCAALRLTRYLKGLWPLMMGFLVIPPFLRNLVYDAIAKRRMKWFGRVQNCALLVKEDRARFLDI